MSRELHYCGSLPPMSGATDADIMRWFLDHSAGHTLTGLPTRQDPDWIIAFLRSLARHDDVFEVAVPGQYRNYDDFRSYRVKRGATLLPEHVSHGDVYTAMAQVDKFDTLRATRPELADTRMMLPVPSPIDLALFTFVGATFQQTVPSLAETYRALKHLPVYTQATVHYVRDVTDMDGDDVIFHVEMPSALVGMWKARIVPGGTRLVAWWHANQTAQMLARFPKRAKVIVHLCTGNYNNDEVFEPKDLRYAVVYLNLLKRALLKLGMEAPGVHIPAVFGSKPPRTDAAFFAALAALDPAWIDVIAGVVTEVDGMASVTALRQFETALGRRARAVGCGCGLGRRSREDAETAAWTMTVAADA